MILLTILILSLPTLWELWSERKGEDPKNKWRSMTVRAFLMIVCAGVATGIVHPNVYPWVTSLHLWPLTLTYLKCLFLSFAIFFLTFDYLFNIIFHRKERVWFSYLSESPLDRLFGKLNWRVRMGVRVAVFVASLVWFLNK